MLNLGVQYGYVGIFIISLIGASSIILLVPDSLVVFTISGLKFGENWLYSPLLIAVAAAFGSTLGEFSGYLLGLSGKNFIGKRYGGKMDSIEKIIVKFGSIAIFVFALTPLPDDLVFIPLGLIHYNAVKAFMPALAGKFVMNLMLAYAGRYSVDVIEDTLGVGGDFISALIVFVIGIAFMIMIFKVDWERYFSKWVN
jgi:membrane protein YqaA with SNARE-associated domain